MKIYAKTSPRLDSPLVLACSGWLQKPDARMRYLDFAEMSQLEEACDALGLAIAWLVPRARNWDASAVEQLPEIIAEARRLTGSAGGLRILGFSDGGTFAHRAARRLAATGTPLGGIWCHSAPFPTPAASWFESRPVECAVAVSCNPDETRRLPRLGIPWYSMLDYRRQAAEWYTSAGVTLLVEDGSESGHRWSPDLNLKILRWLNAQANDFPAGGDPGGGLGAVL